MDPDGTYKDIALTMLIVGIALLLWAILTDGWPLMP